MNKKILVVLFITFISVFASLGLFKSGYFSMHDDLQIMRLYEFSRCFQEGQVPCRFAPDLSFGYGQPTFSYYSSSPYYLGGAIHTLGFSYLNTVKILFFISFLLTAIGSYLLVSHFFALPVALFTTSVAVLAPYRLVDIYVRGALSEVFAISLLPLVLYLFVALRDKQSRFTGILLALSLFALATAHLPTLVMVFLPLLVYVLYLIITNFSFSFIKRLLFYSTLGLGLAAYFIVPIIFERSLINTSGLYIDYYDYRLHFVSIFQLLLKHVWGYGPSRLDSDDNFNLSIGYVYLFTFVAFGVLYFKRNFAHRRFSLVFFALSFFLLFMNHARSNFIYQTISIYQNIQFPWRFLGPLSVFMLPVVGFVFQKAPTWLLGGVFIALLTFTYPQLRFEHYFPDLTDTAKLSGQNFITQQGSAINDYLPLDVETTPTKPVEPKPVFVSGEGGYDYSDRRGVYYSTEVTVYTPTAIIRLPFSYFPNLDIYLNRIPQKVAYTINPVHAQPEIELPRGKHLIQAYQVDTPIRQLGNIITFISFMTLGLLLFWPKHKQLS